MASIVDKAFDATQRIMRTIFRGSPNLFTTADLNRQIEAIDYRLRQLEWFRGVETDADVSIDNNAVVLTGTYIRVFGCVLVQRDTVGVLVQLNVTGISWENTFVYLTPQVITYADDPSHAISGAKFQDSTSLPAADNIQVTSWGLCCDASAAGKGTIYNRPSGPITNDGTWNLQQQVPEGALLIPLISRHTDNAGSRYYKHFYKDDNKVLLQLVNNFYPETTNVEDEDSWCHILPAHDLGLVEGYFTGFALRSGWLDYLKVRLEIADTPSTGHSGTYASKACPALAPFVGMRVPVALSMQRGSTPVLFTTCYAICEVRYGVPTSESSGEGYYLAFVINDSYGGTGDGLYSIEAQFIHFKTVDFSAPGSFK